MQDILGGPIGFVSEAGDGTSAQAAADQLTTSFPEDLSKLISTFLKAVAERRPEWGAIINTPVGMEMCRALIGHGYGAYLAVCDLLDESEQQQKVAELLVKALLVRLSTTSVTFTEQELLQILKRYDIHTKNYPNKVKLTLIVNDDEESEPENENT